MTPLSKAQLVKNLARAAGFDRVGITDAAPLRRAAYYRRWLANGHSGEMNYLHHKVPERLDPSRLFPGARTIVCLALSYKRTKPDMAPSCSDGRAADAPAGRIAQYAQGRDYHVLIRPMLTALEERMRAELAEPFEARKYVDTGPLIERELAARAGVGWIGRNTCILTESHGSFLFLAELVTSLDLALDPPATDHCGSCTRCIDACPTAALTAPYEMDATRCIAYLTIEHRGDIPSELQRSMGDWVYGCDICQDVCPFNRKAPATRVPELSAEVVPQHVPLAELLSLTSGGHRRLTQNTATRRADRHNWRRNAAIAAGNALQAVVDEAQREALIGGLHDAARSTRPAVRSAAQGALSRPADRSSASQRTHVAAPRATSET